MVDRVLTSNGITSHAGGVYSLIGADDLSEIERDATLQLLPPGPVHWADAEQRQLAWGDQAEGMEGGTLSQCNCPMKVVHPSNEGISAVERSQSGRNAQPTAGFASSRFRFTPASKAARCSS